MPDLSVEIDATELSKALRGFGNDMAKPAQILRPTMDILTLSMSVPWDTGELDASERITFGANYGEVLWGAPYAAAVHKRQPWASDAVARKEGQVIDAIVDGVADLQHKHGLN